MSTLPFRSGTLQCAMASLLLRANVAKAGLGSKREPTCSGRCSYAVSPWVPLVFYNKVCPVSAKLPKCRVHSFGLAWKIKKGKDFGPWIHSSHSVWIRAYVFQAKHRHLAQFRSAKVVLLAWLCLKTCTNKSLVLAMQLSSIALCRKESLESSLVLRVISLSPLQTSNEFVDSVLRSP